jgi:hypothetical protein
MKRLMLVALLGSLSLAAPAQTTADNAVTIRGYSIELPATAYRMFPGDFDDYKRVYDLANGDTLAMRQMGRRMLAQVGDGEPKELVAAAPGVFVALDRELKITLNRDNFGDFRGEVLMVVPGRATAQAYEGRHIRLLSAR